MRAKISTKHPKIVDRTSPFVDMIPALYAKYPEIKNSKYASITITMKPPNISSRFH